MERFIVPAFRQYQEEGLIVGRLITGYGEIEFLIQECVGRALQDDITSLQRMYSTRGEERRLRIADTLLESFYEENGMGSQYADALGAARYCKQIRNQFAHCHWYAHRTNGLFFMNLEDADYKDGTAIVPCRHVDVPLLRAQEDYFCYASDCFQFLYHEIDRLRGEVGAHLFPMPPKRSRPSLYNPPEEHPIQPLDTLGPSSPVPW